MQCDFQIVNLWQARRFWQSRFVIRLAIGNLATTWQDVEEAYEVVQKAADEV
jgi:hypothetical protein